VRPEPRSPEATRAGVVGSARELPNGGTAPERVRNTAPVLEVFGSIQGEGAFVGEPQTFLRLRGCPLRCRWCDTPGSWRVGAGPLARVVVRTESHLDPDGSVESPQTYGAPSDRDVRREPAWATAFQALCWISAAEGPYPRTISVTGGEPLLWPDFLIELRRLAGDRRIHLETAGAHPETLARVRDSVDHLSVDLKLPSTLDAPVTVDEVDGEPTPRTAAEWRAVRHRVLALVRNRDACAKLVLPGGVPPAEVEELLDDVARIARELPVFLQPATPIGTATAPDEHELRLAIDAAEERELNVRVVPQVHRLLGVE
jgi:organic radical activating enzyme